MTNTTNSNNTENTMNNTEEAILKNREKLVNELPDAFFKTIKSYDLTLKQFKILNHAVDFIRTNEKGDFLSIDTATPTDISVSYSRDANKPFEPNLRVSTSLGKYFRRIIGINGNELNDQILDRFVKTVTSDLYIPDEKDFTFITGADIMKFYETTKITSCMTGKVKAENTEMYTLNPEKISLVTVSTKVRGLMWKGDDGTWLLDRLYPGDAKEADYILKWANNKGYLYSSHHHYTADRLGISQHREPEYKKAMEKFRITLKGETYVPYLDTMNVLIDYDNDKKQIVLGTNYNHRGHKSRSVYSNQFDGRYYMPWVKLCYCANCYKRKDEASLVASKNKDSIMVCQVCFDRGYYKCVDCDVICRRGQFRFSSPELNDKYCSGCVSKYAHMCDCCGAYDGINSFVEKLVKPYCGYSRYSRKPFIGKICSKCISSKNNSHKFFGDEELKKLAEEKKQKGIAAAKKRAATIAAKKAAKEAEKNKENK